MGVFGPTNEELENLRAEFQLALSQGIDNLSQKIEAKITAVEVAAAVRATDSEESAKSAAEKAAGHAAAANESGEHIQAALQEIVRYCSGQVISDSLIGFFDVDSRSKALGDKLPSFECSLMLL